MHHRDLLLEALNYSTPISKHLDQQEQFATLVLWLENTKIRQYTVDDRKKLSHISDPAWFDCYCKYLGDVQCPVSLEETSKLHTLDWLLNYAVSLEFQDQADKYNKPAAKKAARLPQQSNTQAGKSLYTDIDSQETKQAIGDLLQRLKLPVNDIAEGQHLQVVKDLVADQLLPALEDSELSKATREAANPKTDVAATILRMLYIRDLRGLQSTIDQTLVEVQNYTANPKTDAALGRIGR